MRKIVCLFLVLFCMLGTLPAIAQEQPGEGDISREAAVERALSFFEETFGFSRLEWPTEAKEARFAPGLMQDGQTMENCWFIVLKNEMPMNALAQVHSKTGEIVCWGCDGEKNLTDLYAAIPGLAHQHFYHALPESGEWLNPKALYDRACADFSYHSDISMSVLASACTVDISYGNTDYIGYLPEVERENEQAIQFFIVAQVPAPAREDNLEISDPVDRWTYTVAYSLPDGEILSQELTMNYAPQPLRSNPLKQ